MAPHNEAHPKRRLAVLVDGDNAPPKTLQPLLAEVAKHGDIKYRRVYGDWTSPNMNGWKEALHASAFTPVQQFRYVSGKNSTDAALIIDAMDILYGGDVDGFCIVTSDSDYTRLATRLREGGMFVLGIGEKKTPKALVSACDEFVYLENIAQVRKPKTAEKQAPARQAAAQQKKGEKGDKAQEGPADIGEFEPLAVEAFESAQDEEGWATLTDVGTQLRVISPGFDPRSYGRRQLSKLVKDTGLFEIQHPPRPGQGDIRIRLLEE